MHPSKGQIKTLPKTPLPDVFPVSTAKWVSADIKGSMHLWTHHTTSPCNLPLFHRDRCVW